MATTESSNRRQSGLWTQNPDTGFFDRQQPQQPSGPYQYYQPTASGSKPPRRSFSDRTGNSMISDAYIAATQNKVSGAGSILDKSRMRTLALETHAKIASSLHAYSGDSKSEDFARSGHAVHVHSPNAPIPKARKLRRDLDDVDPNAVPENVRATAWSPEPESGMARQVSGDAEAGGPARRPSVSERSPLQKLEGNLDNISKKEKRARMEQLENVARQKSLSRGDVQPARSNTLRSEKGRVVSDGSRRPSESRSDKYYRQVTAGAPQALPPDNAAMRFRRASDALRNGEGSRGIDERGAPPERQRSVRGPPPIVNNPRPYHHAPEAPRSLGVADPQPGVPPSIARRAQPYQHAPEAPTSVNVAGYPHNAGRTSRDGGSRSISNPMPMTSNANDPTGVNRSASYKRRLRDAGFAGAAAAAAGTAGYAAYEMSGKRQGGDEPSPVSPNMPANASLGRTESRKLQKPYPPSEEWRTGGRRSMEQQPSASIDGKGDKSALQSARIGNGDNDIPPASQDVDPIPRATVATGPDVAVPYKIPPQTAGGQAAREQVGFHQERMSPQRRHSGYGAENTSPVHQQLQDKHHNFGGIFHRNGEAPRSRAYVQQKPLEEWRTGKILRLTVADIELDRDAPRSEKDNVWWESKKARRSTSGGAAGVSAAQYDGPFEEDAKAFRPPLFLKCGPLLRYTGIRKETSSSGRGEREIWRGSIMVVTEDDQSEYSTVPTLRMFAQPMDLHTPPTRQMLESGQAVPPEDEDPVAGQVKVSRTGRPLYVRPVHDIEGEIDLSREENNQGLYAATRAPMLGPQFSSNNDGRTSAHITFQDKSRIHSRDGEKAGRYRDLRAIRLHNERGFTFWRWSIEIELGSTQHRIAYRINRGPALGFWVPARGESMNIMFHSCNGFSMSVDSNQFSGPDPLWRDVLNRHQSRPFHVMLGGGDQIYNDAAMRDTTLFREWSQIKNPEHKHHAEFTPELQEELEAFYFHRYSMWFSQGLFAMATSQVPMVNLWDDHDIIDGFGSYPHHFMSTPVFTGVGAVAFKYYMLFQHQSLVAETAKEEPSWVLGASPGPYINELSRSVFVSLGRGVSFLGIDCRTERMRHMVLSQESYDILFRRAAAEIKKGETKHLLVLLGVPIAYPRLNFLENVLTSRAMDPIKALGRTGMLGGFVNKFDGGVEILDDLDDHWTAKHHKQERNWFIEELQELAAGKSVRVTILGGDVHLGAVGQFYSPKKMGIPKDRDHRYIPNVISSAIVNTPPPPMMADVLNKRNKVHHLDDETDEDMIPMFEVDVDGSKRNNKCLLPRRNYCTIREFQPGSTPPGTPPPERSGFATPASGFDDQRGFDGEERDRRYPPGSMMSRTMSLTRGPAKLVRRLSGSGKKGNMPPPTLAQQGGGLPRRNSLGGPPESRGSLDGAEAPQRPINMFHRRPTNLSEKEIRRAAAKGGAPDEDGDGREPGHVDLEGGLDISLNMEIDQRDPSGATRPYRLLVPALWYEGGADLNTTRYKTRGVTFMDRLRGRGKKHEDEEEDWSDGETATPPPSRGQNQQFGGVPVKGPTQQPGYGNDGPYDAAGMPARQSLDAPPRTTAGYKPGYDIPPAPRGSQEQQRAMDPRISASPNYPYPAQQQRQQAQAAQARSGGGAPVSQKHTQQQVPGPYGRAQDEFSEGSLTPSDEFDDGPMGRTPGVQPRRLSKAERFFGIGEGNGRPGESIQEPPVEGKSKPKWMIWR